jgi:hypothetical protein
MQFPGAFDGLFWALCAKVDKVEEYNNSGNHRQSLWLLLDFLVLICHQYYHKSALALF